MMYTVAGSFKPGLYWKVFPYSEVLLYYAWFPVCSDVVDGAGARAAGGSEAAGDARVRADHTERQPSRPDGDALVPGHRAAAEGGRRPAQHVALGAAGQDQRPAAGGHQVSTR